MAADPADDLYERAGKANNVDPMLLRAIAAGESNEQDDAVSSKGALGRMQLMPPTAAAMGVRDPHDPEQAVDGAARLMRINLTATKGDVPMALRLYQGGPNTAKWGPQNAAYPGYIAGHYQQIAQGARPPATRTAAATPKPDDNDAFSAAFGAGTGSSAQPSPAALGAGGQPDDNDAFTAALSSPPEAQPPPVQQARASMPAVDPMGSPLGTPGQGVTPDPRGDTVIAPTAPTYDRSKFGPTATDAQAMMAEQVAAARAQEAAKPAGQQVNEFLSADPKVAWNGNTLPLAQDVQGGPYRLALPSGVRDMARGAFELSQGPATGTVSPEGTNALAMAMMGGMGGSVARGTGAAIGNRLVGQGAGEIAPEMLPALQTAARIRQGGVEALLNIPPRQNEFAAAMARSMPEVDAMGNPTGVSAGMGGPAPAAAPAPNPGWRPLQPGEALSVGQEVATGANGQQYVRGDPGPRSVGAAATPSNMTPMGAREMAATQATGENYRLANPRPPGVDKTTYIPGVQPTAAEVAGNADVSATQKYVSQTPGEEERFRAVQAANNEVRLDYYDNLAGTPKIVNSMREARSAQAETDLPAAWKNKAEVNAEPIVQQIDAVLAGPDGKLSAVSGALGKVRDILHDRQGVLETDPQVLYGARQEVAAMLGKAAQQEKPTLRNAARQLEAIRQNLDATIEKGAPGYGKYLENYATASRPIDTMELLQEARPGLTTGPEKNLRFGAMDRLMRGIVAERQGSGISPAKSLNDETMEALWNLHADTHRLAVSEAAGKAAGSDTSMLGRIGSGIVATAAHGAAGYLSPGIGNLVVNAAKGALGERAAKRQVNRMLDGMNWGGPPPPP